MSSVQAAFPHHLQAAVLPTPDSQQARCFWHSFCSHPPLVKLWLARFSADILTLALALVLFIPAVPEAFCHSLEGAPRIRFPGFLQPVPQHCKACFAGSTTSYFSPISKLLGRLKPYFESHKGAWDNYCEQKAQLFRIGRLGFRSQRARVLWTYTA